MCVKYIVVNIYRLMCVKKYIDVNIKINVCKIYRWQYKD